MRSELYIILTVLSLGLVNGKLKSFSPELSHKTFVTQVDYNELPKPHRLVARSTAHNYMDFAKLYIKATLGYEEGVDYRVLRNQSSGNNSGYVYIKQLIQGEEVFNGDINLSIDLESEKRIVAFGNSFYKNKNFNGKPSFKSVKDTSKLKVSMMECLGVALKASGLTLGNFNRTLIMRHLTTKGNGFSYSNGTNEISKLKATQGWLQLDDEDIVPVWSLDIVLKNEFFNAKVSLVEKKLVSLIDLMSRATYRIYPIGTDGAKSGSRVLEKSPEDPTASPLGWHNNGNEEFNYTRGNNAYVRFSSYAINSIKEDKSNSVTYSDSNSIYDFPLNLKEKDHHKYLNASMTQAFYVANKVHDLLYHYGFDEAAGNFQEKNFGSEGKGNDSVQIFPQFDAKRNGAGFATLPDGEKSYMFIGMVYKSNPPKDLTLDNTVLVHEYGHGLSHRLVGGAENHICLFSKEGRGMGEGWSDLLAIMLLMKLEYTRDIELGTAEFTADVVNARASKYSVSMTSNSVTYGSLKKFSEAHEIGHVWATILYEVYWNLVDKLGFTTQWIGEGSKNPTKYGNTLMLKLVIESMKNLPCEPTFIEARDDLISTDIKLTGGKNKCEIWNGFSKRGLGLHALPTTTKGDGTNNSSIVTSYYENYDMPDECENTSNFLELIERRS